jgi:hypothetical protein
MAASAPDQGVTVRRVALPGGRELLVRPVRADDVDALEKLYAGLDLDDQHRRFFSAYRPPPVFFERLTTVAERGGFGLVALVTSADGTQELVGEANYTMLPNGDGELAITVADRWRGWLGPYLLDALLSAGAARGVPNLDAEVLVTNGPVLALARTRDCVVADRPDTAVIRVLIGTTPPSARWPGAHDLPRVLVEGPGTTWHQEAARAAGLEVVTCPGPLARRTPCPALLGGPCPLAAGADAIVLRHPGPEEQWAELLAAHRQLHAGVPVCLEGTSAAALDDGEVVRAPDGGEAGVVAFVQRLASQRR